MHPRHSPKHPIIFRVAFILFVLSIGLGLLWRFSSLHDRFSLDQLAQWGSHLVGHPWAPFAIMGIYALGGLILFFHAVLLWTTVFLFDPWHAVWYCELGTMASGLTMYGLGRLARPEVVKRIAGSYLDDVSQALGRKGKLTLMVLHWFPICPFSILNFISGATRIGFLDFIVGTFIGCTPGILLIAFFGHQIVHIVSHDHWFELIPIAAAIIIVAVVLRALRPRTQR